jgi:putative spermidine/putrescine transport system ATP-binding protein
LSLRPEKIQLGTLEEPSRPDLISVTGSVRDVVYLGQFTRYLVTLESGEDLVVAQQNLSTTSLDVAAVKGQQVQLWWQRSHMLQLS